MAAVDMAEDSRVHDGHRGRMRAKLLTHGQKIFDTYELLEMLLYYVIPYKDTNPIAKRLLAAFGGLDGVLSAEKEELVGVSGIGNAAADFLTQAGRVASMLASEIVVCDEVNFTDYAAVGEYLVDYFSKRGEFGVVAMFFDNNMRLLGIERLYDLDFESAGVKFGRFLDVAIRKRASVIISAHNHPHGPFYPSRGDLATNESITKDLHMAGILHAEHYIVSGNSFAGISSLKNFAPKFSQCPAIHGFIASKAAAISNAADAGAVMQAGKCFTTADNGLVGEYAEYLTSLFSHVSKSGDKLAERVLGRYRSLEGAMTASVSELTDMESKNFACFVKLLAYVTSRRVVDRFGKGGKRCASSEISEYLKALYLGQSVETAYLLCFDKAGRFLDSVIIGEGTVNSTDILPRKALEAAIERSAKRVVLAHNHPFGTPEASSEDIRLTGVMTSVFAACDIRLEGHYIIAGQLCNVISVKSE